jgi:hypothetical protein
MPRKRWLIEGRRGLDPIFEDELPIGSLSEPGMVTLLQRLCCRHLTYDEIVSASVRRNSSRYAPHLEFEKETTRERFTVSVGHNPWFSAITREGT